MSRGLPPEVVEKLEGNLKFGYSYKGVFDSGELRLWSGLGNITLNGEVYLGNGLLHSSSGFSEETSEVNDQTMRIILSGFPANLLHYALNEAFQRGTCEISMVILNDDDSVLHIEPFFQGQIDYVDINENPNSSEIVFNYVNYGQSINVNREARWTPEEHKVRYPSDLGFDYVPSLEQVRIYWGRPDTTRSS